MAIDNLGRMQFSDMAGRVRSRLNAYQESVDPTTGELISRTITNQLISNVDILNKLNTALVGTYTDIMMRRPEVFATELTIDISQYTTTYAFPLGMIQFIVMMWKPPSVQVVPGPGTNQSPRPTDYIEMVCVDDPHDYEDQRGRYGAPTWRRLGDSFMLNEIPQESNSQGIRVRGVFLPPPIANDLTTPTPPDPTTRVQGMFARLTQELIILEATKNLAQEKMEQEPASLAESLAMWRARVDIAVNNAQVPRSVQFTTGSMVQSTYSGRRRGLLMPVAWRR